MKTPGWQSHPERYDLRHTLALQYAHLDTIRHVNNVAVHGLHVEARIRYQLAVLGQAHLFSDTVLLRPRRPRHTRNRPNLRHQFRPSLAAATS